jgi:uncharacterized protein (DUF58 family)
MDGSALLPQELLSRLERMTLLTRQRARGTMQGKRRSGQIGSSLEFADYRPYAPGDDVRKVDWHAYAKTGRPYVKLYLDEQELQVSIYVDASASMSFQGARLEVPLSDGRSPLHSMLPDKEEGFQTARIRGTDKFLYARQLAACVGYAALSSYDRVGVQLFGETVTARLPMLRGKGSVFRLMDFLIQASTEAKGDLASVFMKPALLPSRPGLTWIFSDFLFGSGVEESVKALLAARQEVRVVQVLAQEEWNPALSGDLRLIDCETGEGKEVAVTTKVLQAYKETVRDYTAKLEGFCRERGVGYYLALTSAPLEDAVLNGFRKNGLFQI